MCKSGIHANDRRAGAKGLPLAALAILCLAGPWPAQATVVQPKSFEETVREAGAIVVARVDEVRSRWQLPAMKWMQTDYIVTVENAIVADESARTGSTITVSFWGGTSGRETQWIAGSPFMNRNDRYVLMLRPEWSRANTPSPLVGFCQGFYPVVDKLENNRDVVVDRNGSPLYSLGGTRIADHAKAMQSKTIPEVATLEVFVRTLRADLPRLRGSRGASAEPTLPVRLSAPSRGSSNELDEQFEAFRALQARGSSGPRLLTELPARASGSAMGFSEGCSIVRAPARGPDSRGSILRWAQADNHCNLPVVVNLLPESAKPWAGVDRECMEVWNHYVKNLFQAKSNPNPTPTWGDKSFDVHGMLDNAELKKRFGKEWPDGVFSFTFIEQNDQKVITEADIAFNAGATFTVNNEEVYDDSPKVCFRWAMMREFGHMAGLLDDPRTESLALLTDVAPAPLRAFSLPYQDDLMGLFENYKDQVIPRTDLGVYTYTCRAEEPGWKTTTFPAEAKVGKPLTLRGLWMENCGTTTCQKVIFLWGLAKERSLKDIIPGGYYRMKEPLKPGFRAYWLDDDIELKVPANCPPGDYYVVFMVMDDKTNDAPTIPEFPFSHAMSFSKNKEKVSN